MERHDVMTPICSMLAAAWWNPNYLKALSFFKHLSSAAKARKRTRYGLSILSWPVWGLNSCKVLVSLQITGKSTSWRGLWVCSGQLDCAIVERALYTRVTTYLIHPLILMDVKILTHGQHICMGLAFTAPEEIRKLYDMTISLTCSISLNLGILCNLHSTSTTTIIIFLRPSVYILHNFWTVQVQSTRLPIPIQSWLSMTLVTIQSTESHLLSWIPSRERVG